MRYDMRDGRRLPPRNAKGEFRRRRTRADRGMDYGEHEHRRMRGEHEYRRQPEYGYDGHYGSHGGRTGGYEPVEFMGYCTGYAGAKEDYARGDMGYRNYDMRGRDYGYPMHERHYPPYDYGYPYDDYGDYGETLSEKELEEWNRKLLGQLDEREKQMFSKEAIMQKAKQMSKPMEGFGEKELYTTVLMIYSDYKQSIGANPDLAIRLAFDWLLDKDTAVKGAEKLSIYYDCIVEGEE